MKNLLFFATILLMVAVIAVSCSKEGDSVVPNTITDETSDVLLKKYELLNNNPAVDFAFANYSQGLGIIPNYNEVGLKYSTMYSIKEAELAKWVKEAKTTDSFTELVKIAYDSGLVTESQKQILSNYDALVFSDISREEIISNIEKLNEEVINSNNLSSLEREELLKLNASIIYGLNYSPEGIAQLRANGWGCAAGIAVTITAGFLIPNPLGVIAGAMVIDKYC